MTPSPCQPRFTVSAPPCQSALCLQPDPRVPEWRASGLFPGRRTLRVPTSHRPAAALPPCSPQAWENESDTQALAASLLLLLLALLQQWVRPPSVTVQIILTLRHIMPSPPLSASPPPPPYARAPSPSSQIPAAGASPLCGGARDPERLALPGSRAETG